MRNWRRLRLSVHCTALVFVGRISTTVNTGTILQRFAGAIPRFSQNRSGKMTTQSRAVLQRMLQRRTNWQTPSSRTSPSSESFGCPHCHAKYADVRRRTPPGIIPTCEDCDQDFPPTENGEWLIYEREDA